jgi:hypothetical protein
VRLLLHVISLVHRPWPVILGSSAQRSRLQTDFSRQRKQMKMEALAYLARDSDSSDDDDFDSSEGRPTPLDPEYWRGITHSVPVNRQPSPATAHYAHSNSYPVYHQHQRPVTSPSSILHDHGHYGGAVLMSPIHYQNGPPMIPISPVAHMDAMHEASYGLHSGAAMAHGLRDWGGSSQPRSHPTAVSPVSTPQQLKLQIREAFVRAQAYLDLMPFFQSYDVSYAGGVRLGTVQEALGRMGVILRDHVLQSIGQLFSIPGSSLIDYIALARFLELDAQEL